MRALSKEPNDILVLTTCKCRENNSNLVMTRTWFEEQLANKIEQGARQERERITAILSKTVDEYSADKRLIEAAVVSNAISEIKAGNE